MNNLIPYISSEPPPIHDDTYEHDSYNTEFFNPYNSGTSMSNNVNEDNEMEVDQYIEQSIQPNGGLFQYNNYGKDNCVIESRSPAELFQYIENVIDKNNLRIDETDSALVKDISDNLSERSIDGEFDDYIENIYIDKDNINSDTLKNQIYDTNNTLNHTNIDTADISDLNISKIVANDNVSKDYLLKSEDLKEDDFGDFPSVIDNCPTNYFANKLNDEFNTDVSSINFADFSSVNETTLNDDIVVNEISEKENILNCVNNAFNCDDDFDDFDDFATFENYSQPISPTISKQEKETINDNHQTLENLLENLLSTFNSIDCDMSYTENIMNLSGISISDSFISNQRLFDEMSLVIWKELTNYDYSPAFIFQWMQSATYERFMSSIGSEYRDMLSSHRATLPLYSVNLTPIEPILVDNCLPINVSASNSSIDLNLKDESVTGLPYRNSNIDFKNLEEEFVFNQFASPIDMKSPDITSTINPSPISNISSTVVQSDRFGGILKSILKPLNPTKSSVMGKPVNPQAEAVLKELPDLSYMSSKVLMFPVISSCDVEDNI